MTHSTRPGEIRRTMLAIAATVLLAASVEGTIAPSAQALASPPCANDFMTSDLRCAFYSQLDADEQAAVLATANDLGAVPSLPATPDEESGGPTPVDLPLDLPQPLPVAGISSDIGAPESTHIFQAENNYTGNLPDGTEARVWAGASGIDPSVGEVTVVILTSDANSVISTKLLTAPSRHGPLHITSSIDASNLLLTAADNTTFRYAIDADHIVPSP